MSIDAESLTVEVFYQNSRSESTLAPHAFANSKFIYRIFHLVSICVIITYGTLK